MSYYFFVFHSVSMTTTTFALLWPAGFDTEFTSFLRCRRAQKCHCVILLKWALKPQKKCTFTNLFNVNQNYYTFITHLLHFNLKTLINLNIYFRAREYKMFFLNYRRNRNRFCPFKSINVKFSFIHVKYYNR